MRDIDRDISQVFPTTVNLENFEIMARLQVDHVPGSSPDDPHAAVKKKLVLELHELDDDWKNKLQNAQSGLMTITLPAGSNPGDYRNHLFATLSQFTPEEGFTELKALQDAIIAAAGKISGPAKPAIDILPFPSGGRKAV